MSDHPPSDTNPDNKTAILIADFQSARDDQRIIDQVVVGVMSVIGVLIPVFAVIVSKTCPSGTTPKCSYPIWPPSYVVFPLILISLFAYLIVLGSVSTVRSYYLRDLEEELRAEMGKDSASEFPSLMHLLTPIMSQRRGFGRFRFMLGMIYVTVGFFGIAISVECIQKVRPVELQVLSILLYVLILVLLGWGALGASVGGNRLWMVVYSRLEGERRHTEARVQSYGSGLEEKSKNRLLRYLLIPRPQELVIKSLFLGLSCVYVHWIYRNGGDWYVDLVIAWIAFELLFYQGRYILNDLRGIDTDALYSAGKSRSRFPILDSDNLHSEVRFGLKMALLRMAIGIWVGVQWLKGQNEAAFLAAAAVTLVIAVVYDGLRDHRDEDESSLFRFTGTKISILALVGTGYGVRILLGWVLAEPHHLVASAMIISGVAFCVFGSMFVAITFSLDGLRLLRTLDHGDRNVSLIKLCGSSRLMGYPHKGPLLLQAVAQLSSPYRKRRVELPSLKLYEGRLCDGPSSRALIPFYLGNKSSELEVCGDPKRKATKANPNNAYDWKLLLAMRTPFTWVNFSFLLAMALVGLGSGDIAGLNGSLWILTAALGIVAALISIRFSDLWLSLAGGMGVWLVSWLDLDNPLKALQAAIPVFAVALVYEIFRRMSLRDLENDIPRMLGEGITTAVRLSIHLVVLLLVGRRVLESNDASPSAIEP
jgi:hypothetical protein